MEITIITKNGRNRHQNITGCSISKKAITPKAITNGILFSLKCIVNKSINTRILRYYLGGGSAAPCCLVDNILMLGYY